MSTIAKHTPGSLIDRLRGIYRIPITDGLGAVGSGEEPDNPSEFVRRFETSPIKSEAADAIEAMLEALTDCAAILPRYRLAGETTGHDEELDAVLERVTEAIGKATGGAS